MSTEVHNLVTSRIEPGNELLLQQKSTMIGCYANSHIHSLFNVQRLTRSARPERPAHGPADCTSRPLASLVGPQSVPMYWVGIRRSACRLSILDRRCAMPLQHSPPARTKW